MFLRLHLTLLTLLAAGFSLARAAGPDPARFEKEILQFEAADRAARPPTNAILFAGSSSFRLWTNLAASFPDRVLINRGFGGSHFSDLLHYFDRIVAPYQPRLILVYEGDNDLASGKTVDEVFGDWTNLVARVRARLPGTGLGFVAVKPSPSRLKFLEAQRDLNGRIREFCQGSPEFRYFDVVAPMLDAGGQPRPELFIKDQLHLNQAGYALWQDVIARELNLWERARRPRSPWLAALAGGVAALIAALWWTRRGARAATR